MTMTFPIIPYTHKDTHNLSLQMIREKKMDGKRWQATFDIMIPFFQITEPINLINHNPTPPSYPSLRYTLPYRSIPTRIKTQFMHTHPETCRFPPRCYHTTTNPNQITSLNGSDAHYSSDTRPFAPGSPPPRASPGPPTTLVGWDVGGGGGRGRMRSGSGFWWLFPFPFLGVFPRL